jgi:hypothetical protein
VLLSLAQIAILVLLHVTACREYRVLFKCGAYVKWQSESFMFPYASFNCYFNKKWIIVLWVKKNLVTISKRNHSGIKKILTGHLIKFNFVLQRHVAVNLE